MRTLLLSVLLLHIMQFGGIAQAQSAPGGHLTAHADSSGSYWRVLTDAKSRSTRVQFFGADRVLLYEEDVPEKWIKQSKRNQRRLNKLLADISASKLILSRLKAEDLPAEPARVTRPASGTENRDTVLVKTSYQIHVSINADGKVRLAVNNPESLRYKIEIGDYRDRIVYQEFTSHEQYRRYLDISPVIGETAKVILTIDGKRLVYNIKKVERRNAYTIGPVIAGR